jgi:hypothetical protein
LTISVSDAITVQAKDEEFNLGKRGILGVSRTQVTNPKVTLPLG